MADLALKGVGLAAHSVRCGSSATWPRIRRVGPGSTPWRISRFSPQPNRIHAVEAAVKAAALESDARRTGRAISIDMTPTGAVSLHEQHKPGPARHDVRIIELNAEDALIETPEGYRRVKPGDEIPEIGKIISIRKMGEYWVVVASLKSLAQIAPQIER